LNIHNSFPTFFLLSRTGQEYISNPKAAQTLLKMLKNTQPEATSALSLLPLLDAENHDPADLTTGTPTASATTSRLLAREAENMTNAIALSSHIAGFVQDLGPVCTASTEAFRETLKESGVAMDERQAALLLCLVVGRHTEHDNEMSAMAANELLPSTASTTASGNGRGNEGGEGDTGNRESASPPSWNLDVMASVLAADYSSLDWARVALELDNPRLFIADQEALRNLLSLYQRASSNRPFPLGVLFRRWTNKVGQLSFIHQAIAAPPDLVSFSGIGRMQNPLDDTQIPQGPPNKAWLSIDLIATLLSFSETSLWYSARTLFDGPLRQCPEILICGLACVEDSWGKLRSELLALLGPMYFQPGRSPHAVAVIKRVHQTNPKLLVETLVERFRQEESAAVVRDILAVMLLVPSTQQDVLSSSCVEFVVALAAAAADKVRSGSHFLCSRYIPGRISA
jgi:CCR4-NOT transcription complex subunit 1